MNSIPTKQIDGDVAVGRNVSAGGDCNIQGKMRVGHNLIVEGWLDARNIKTPNKGLFSSVEKLREQYPVPSNGWWALVGDTLPAPIYIAEGGEWISTGKEGGNPVIDDEEKIIITTMNSYIKEIQSGLKLLKKSVDEIKESKGMPNGIATLDGNGLVTTSQLPREVFDVVEFNAIVEGVKVESVSSGKRSGDIGCMVVYDKGRGSFLLAEYKHSLASVNSESWEELLRPQRGGNVVSPVLSGDGESTSIAVRDLWNQEEGTFVLDTSKFTYYNNWVDGDLFGVGSLNGRLLERGKIYTCTSDDRTFKWGVDGLVVIGNVVTLGNSSGSAYPGDKGQELLNEVRLLKRSLEILEDYFGDGRDLGGETATGTIRELVSRLGGLSHLILGVDDSYSGRTFLKRIESLEGDVGHYEPIFGNDNLSSDMRAISEELDRIYERLEWQLGNEDEMGDQSSLPPGIVLFNGWSDERGEPVSYVGNNVTSRNVYVNETAGCFFMKLSSGERFNNWLGADYYGEPCYDESTGEMIGRKLTAGRLYYCISDGEIYRAYNSNAGVRLRKETHTEGLIESNAKAVLNESNVGKSGSLSRRVLHQRPMSQYSEIGEAYYASLMRIKVDNSGGKVSGYRVVAGELSLATLFPSGLSDELFWIQTLNCDAWYDREKNVLYWDMPGAGAGKRSDVTVYGANYNRNDVAPEVLIRTGGYEKKIWIRGESGAVKMYESTDSEYKNIKGRCELLQSSPVDVKTFCEYVRRGDKRRFYSKNLQIQKRGRVKREGVGQICKWVNVLIRRNGHKVRPGTTSRYVNTYGVYRARRRTRRQGWSEWRYFAYLKAGVKEL